MNPQLQATLQQVIQAFQDGNFDGAQSILAGILQAEIESANTIFELGTAYANANKLAEALAIFHCLQPYKNEDARILYNLGLIYSLQGEHQRALEAYDLALKINPDDVETLINKGSTCNDIKNYALALEVLEKAIQIRSDIPEVWSNKGIALHNLNLYQEAIDAYGEAIRLNPNYYEAWSNKSVPLNKLKRFSEAIDACDQAISLMPDYAQAWFNKGITLGELKRYDEAIAHYDKALSFKPDNVEAWSNKALALGELKRYDEAFTHYDKALSLKPDYAECWVNKGVALYELKRYDEAIACYDKALSLKPDYAECWVNKGVALYELKRYDEAIACYDKALSLKPDYAECWMNKGVTLYELKRYEEVLLCYDKAISLKPDNAEAWSDKALALSELKRYDEAFIHYDKALCLKSDFIECWLNKGVALYELKRYDEAMTCYDKALSLKPDYAEAWSNKAVGLNELKLYDEAIACYDKTLSLKPDMAWMYGDLVHAKMKICNWSGLADSLNTISEKVISNEKVSLPFTLLSLVDDALLHKRCSEIYIQSKCPENTYLGPISKLAKTEKIRLGYFSADFKNHPVSVLIAELFELHDKSKFETIAFSYIGVDNSPMGKRISSSFNQFIDVSNMSDMAIASLARNLGVDIAIDLGGFTANSRPGIFSYRAAPVQASYIGYLGTAGSKNMDYLLADNTIIPPNSRHLYCEKISYLPSYQVNDRKRLISDRLFTKRELGLPENGFVYCCFNNNFKILPDVFSSWMRILKATEGSVLFLYAENQWAEINLKKEADARGIDSSRLIFGKHLPMDEYLARYRVCDLFLDTLPYNAGTTTSDALWAGLPVLTRMGESFASRVAASLLNAIDMPELIAKSQDEYEALAIEIAKNPQKLADIKLKLDNNRLSTPLFNTPLFTKNLETAYIKMYDRYHDGLCPDHMP